MRIFVKELYRAWNVSNPARLAAALAYYSMFSFAPLIFIAFTVASLFIDELVVAEQIFTRLEKTLGAETSQFIYEIVLNVSQRTSGGTLLTSLISFGALFYAASGLFAQLQYALDTIWQTPTAGQSGLVAFIKNRLLAFVMVISLGLLLVVTNFASLIISILSTFIDLGRLAPMFNIGVVIVVTTVSFALLYKVLPQANLAWRDVWVGAVVTALLFNLGRWLVGFYLAHSRVSSAFEAAGTLAVLLIAVYYGAQIFLFGAVFTRVYAATFGSKRAPGSAIET